MNENTVLKVSFIGFILFFLASVFYYKHIDTPIKNLEYNKFYCVKGNFSKIKTYKNFIIGKIEDKTGTISVFISNYSIYFEVAYNLKNNTYIRICGKIKNYKGSMEIIPEKIEVIS